MIKKSKILLVDYQSTSNYTLSDEEKYLQRVKKSIIYVQNMKNKRDVSRKTRKNYSNLLLSLGAYLKKNGHSVFYVSIPSDENLYKEKLAWADLVYYWSTTPVFPLVKDYIISAKEKYPNIKTILAGYHATGIPKQILEEVNQIDYISIGESEYAIHSIMNGVALEKIPGIAYRENYTVKINPTPKLLNGDEIPAPDYSLLNGEKTNYRYYLQMTRSCVYRCKYCVYGYFGGKVRTRSIDSIKQELIELKAIMGNKFEMHILDNIISYDIPLLDQLCKLLDELNMHLSFSADIRPEMINEEVLNKLEKINVNKLFIGFEDANEKCREVAGRKMDSDILVNALKLIKKHKTICANCYWMLGLPGTSKETFVENINYVQWLIESKLIENICPDTIFVPLPGTPLFNEAEKYGIKNLEDNWLNYRRSNYWPVYELDTISKEDFHEGMLNFDKGIISSQLKMLNMSENDVLKRYFNSNNGQNVEEFLK